MLTGRRAPCQVIAKRAERLHLQPTDCNSVGVLHPCAFRMAAAAMIKHKRLARQWPNRSVWPSHGLYAISHQVWDLTLRHLPELSTHPPRHAPHSQALRKRAWLMTLHPPRMQVHTDRVCVVECWSGVVQSHPLSTALRVLQPAHQSGCTPERGGCFGPAAGRVAGRFCGARHQGPPEAQQDAAGQAGEPTGCCACCPVGHQAN